MRRKMSNEGCKTQAQKSLARGAYLDAMRWFNTAAARTIGHKKRERYEACAYRAAIWGDIRYSRMDFARDDEAK